jgi:putative flavoprotein involved in K+ transport
VLDSGGNLRHRRGVTDVPGLYFLGLSWQHTRGSALLGWVKDDAEFIAAQIAAKAETAFVGGETTEDEAIRDPLAAGVAQEV